MPPRADEESRQMPTLPTDVLVVGVARNCAKTLRRTYRTIEQAFSGFQRRHWFLVESDSSDATIDTLQQLESLSPKFKFAALGNLREVISSRTERIAHCRNVYLDEIRARQDLAEDSIIAVADLDGINDLLNRTAVESCFARDDWSVCTANQSGPYYDIYALRHPTWCPDDWWKQHDFARDLGVTEHESIRFACHSKMLEIPRTAPWIPVQSAFGGFALYRSHVLRRSPAKYVGVDENGVGICEHVPLHLSLAAAGEQIFINPQMINAKYTEHTRELVGRRQVVASLNMLLKIMRVQAQRFSGIRR